MAKQAIDNLVIPNIARSTDSHKAGWAYLWKSIIETITGEPCDVIHGDPLSPNDHTRKSWDDYEKVYIYHGMEFTGGLNLFEGANSRSAAKMMQIANFKGELVSLDIDMPMYGTLCKGRVGTGSATEEWNNADWDAVDARCKTIPRLAMEDLEVDNYVVGDSHSFSVWMPGAGVSRNDGKTMHGAINAGIDTLLPKGRKFKKLTCYFGNIDIRHHICRQDDAFTAIVKLMMRYEDELLRLQKSGIAEQIEVVTLLPIEDESRKLPKTGYYKGTPYYGSRKTRQALVEYFNKNIIELAEQNNWDVFIWPSHWYTMSGIEFFKHMEKPRSVHLSQDSYRWNHRLGKENTESFKQPGLGALFNI